MSMPTNTTAFALGDVYFKHCEQLEEFFSRLVRDNAGRFSDGGQEHSTYNGSLIRVHGWLRSLCRLNHACHFQAILSASRSLFEIAVDLTILRFDTRNDCAKLLAWEDSNKFRFAERTVNFAGGNTTDPRVRNATRYISQNRPRIDALRNTYWNGHHPRSRWTGNSLDRDAVLADGFDQRGFAEYYNYRYPEVCWSVHGTGLTGVRHLDESTFPGLAAFGFAESSNFALIAAEQGLALLNAFDLITEHRFKQFIAESAEVRARAWQEHVNRGAVQDD